jgi:hypothetical protein
MGAKTGRATWPDAAMTPSGQAGSPGRLTSPGGCTPKGQTGTEMWGRPITEGDEIT